MKFCKRCKYFGGRAWVGPGYPCFFKFEYDVIGNKSYADCCEKNKNKDCRDFKLKWYLRLF